MIRRLVVSLTIVAPAACAGVLGLDPGTLRAPADSGPDVETGAEPEADAAPEARGCVNALGPGIYCDDFDEPGRTDPSAREAKATDGADSLSLVTDVFKSAPRALKATYVASGFPRGYLTMPRRGVDGSFHLTLKVRVPRDGITQGSPFIVAELQEVEGREGITYSIHLTPRQDAIELKLREASGTLIFHSKTFPYDEWHVLSMQFSGRSAFIELDGDSVSGGTPELTGDYYVHFGLYAFAPTTVFLDDVEIGP